MLSSSAKNTTPLFRGSTFDLRRKSHIFSISNSAPTSFEIQGFFAHQIPDPSESQVPLQRPLGRDPLVIVKVDRLVLPLGGRRHIEMSVSGAAVAQEVRHQPRLREGSEVDFKLVSLKQFKLYFVVQSTLSKV